MTQDIPIRAQVAYLVDGHATSTVGVFLARVVGRDLRGHGHLCFRPAVHEAAR